MELEGGEFWLLWTFCSLLSVLLLLALTWARASLLKPFQPSCKHYNKDVSLLGVVEEKSGRGLGPSEHAGTAGFGCMWSSCIMEEKQTLPYSNHCPWVLLLESEDNFSVIGTQNLVSEKILVYTLIMCS